jgi:hypothetical protein
MAIFKKPVKKRIYSFERFAVNTGCSTKGGTTVGITDAKKLIYKTCDIHWIDRRGNMMHTVSKVYDVTFVPLYGGYLIVDTEDIRLDKVSMVTILEEDGSTIPFYVKEEKPMPVAA